MSEPVSRRFSTITESSRGSDLGNIARISHQGNDVADVNEVNSSSGSGSGDRLVAPPQKLGFIARAKALFSKSLFKIFSDNSQNLA